MVEEEEVEVAGKEDGAKWPTLEEERGTEWTPGFAIRCTRVPGSCEKGRRIYEIDDV